MNAWLRVCVYFLAFVVLVCIVTIVLYVNQFNNSITAEDRCYADRIIKDYGIDTSNRFTSFQAEVSFIRNVQKAVVNLSIVGEGIPMNHERNIKDLYNAKMGLCYDNSHVIEKILNIYGFTTRHVSIYYYDFWYQKYLTFVNSQSSSHAVSEVKTQKGWMFVDSLSEIIGLGENQEPVSLFVLRDLIYCRKANKIVINNNNFQRKFVFLYGVYSRNGRLYAPYNSLPDYQLKEIFYNF